MDMFPLWAVPTNDNMIQVIVYPSGSKDFIFNYKVFISINSGRVAANNE